MSALDLAATDSLEIATATLRFISGHHLQLTGSLFQGVSHASGAITTFDAPGATNTLASSINPSGAILGYYVDASNVFHGFLVTGE